MAKTPASPPPPRPYALVAEFKDTPQFVHAAERCSEHGFTRWDCYSPLPVHGLDDAMGLKRSKVPYFTLVGGLTGFTLACLITWYMNAYDYPLIVGGKPYWSPVFPFPVLYELTILLSAFGTLGGMFLMNLLPRHHHPIFDFERFESCGDDTYLIAVERSDPLYDENQTRAFLQELGAEDVSLAKS